MQTTSSTDSHRIVTPDDLKWETVYPGTQIAVVAGDPTKPGPFVIRQKTAAGAMVPPHWHPTTESVTVLQGTFAMGIGDKLDKTKLTRMHPGDFSTVPATVPHFAMPETDVSCSSMPWARGSLMSSTRLMMRAAEALPIPDGWICPGLRRQLLARFLWRYCHVRPHSSLGGRTPYEVDTEIKPCSSRPGVTMSGARTVQ